MASQVSSNTHTMTLPMPSPTAGILRSGLQTPPLRAMSSFTRTHEASSSPSFFTHSPHRTLPPLLSPTPSIFERDVESVAPRTLDIPSHIATENHIPSVLDASSVAITDSHLDPETIEIITANNHQLAASPFLPPTSWYDDLASLSADRIPDDASISNFGSFEARAPSPATPPTDIRRLSFISFADMVQSEQTPHLAPLTPRRDSLHPSGLASLDGLARSASPKHSTVHSLQTGSPSASVSGEFKRAIDMSPERRSVAIIPVAEPDVAVETMAQALRRTTSGDLGVARGRSHPVSPI